MAARKKAGGQTPEPTNRNHIDCSCGILPVAAYGGKLNLSNEIDWGEPQGNEVW